MVTVDADGRCNGEDSQLVLGCVDRIRVSAPPSPLSHVFCRGLQVAEPGRGLASIQWILGNSCIGERNVNKLKDIHRRSIMSN